MALLAADQGKRVLVIEVDAKGNITDRFESRPVGFQPRRCTPGSSARDGHRGEPARIPEAEPEGPGRRTDRTARPGARLRGDGRARREGGPHDRQGLLGGPRGARRPRGLGPRGGRRRSHGPRDLAARRAGGDPRARRGRSGALPDRVDDRDPQRRRAHRAQRRRHAGRDARRGDHRPRRPGRARSSRSRSARSS